MAKKPRKAKKKKAGKNGAGTLDELKKLYEFMQTNGLQSLELDRNGMAVAGETAASRLVEQLRQIRGDSRYVDWIAESSVGIVLRVSGVPGGCMVLIHE